tara:strand:- start:998 stop:1369 length:372 start_codon:yes stop_codon:yes gene_type:complete
MVIGPRKHPLSQTLKPNGYLHFSKSEGAGKPNQTLSHRFIYEFFKGPIPDRCDIDHIDGNRTNNRISNLQALTPKENVQKALGKLTQWQADKIRRSTSRGVDLANEYGVSQQIICNIKKGRNY